MSGSRARSPAQSPGRARARASAPRAGLPRRTAAGRVRNAGSGRQFIIRLPVAEGARSARGAGLQEPDTAQPRLRRLPRSRAKRPRELRQEAARNPIGAGAWLASALGGYGLAFEPGSPGHDPGGTACRGPDGTGNVFRGDFDRPTARVTEVVERALAEVSSQTARSGGAGLNLIRQLPGATGHRPVTLASRPSA